MPLLFKRRYLYRKENESGAKRFKMDFEPKEVMNEIREAKAILYMQQIGRGMRNGELIDRDLLQDIRDALDEGSIESFACIVLRDKLDQLYPFLNR
jgi:hypothetical protein